MEQKLKLNEPKWKAKLIEDVWEYARNELHVEKAQELPPGLGDLIIMIRTSCDRCGIPAPGSYHFNNHNFAMNARYQCCRVNTEEEEYIPKLCDACHLELQKQRPHETISV